MSMTYDDRIAPAPRRAAPRRPAAKGRTGGLAWLRRRFRARPGATIAHGLFAAAALAVVVNAVAWQAGAPDRAEVAAERAEPPVPPQRPADLAHGRQAAQPAAAPQQQAAAPAQPAPRAAAPQREAASRPEASRDAIGDLIRTGMVPGMEAPRPPAPVVERASLTGGQERGGQERGGQERTVMAAQRALNKLGFGPVREDGRFGEGTRAALERFERERRIPVTRDLSARTQRELAAASGIRME